LVKAGAASAVNVELSSSYRDAAGALALEAGLEGRVELIAGDAIDLAGRVGTAEIVVMNRVVCCYPDGEQLMDVGIGAATKLLGVSYPSIHPLSRAVVGFENWSRSRRGSEFRAFVHGHSTFARPEAAGFRQVYRRNRPIWDIRVWERSEGG
jgi:magnesium-protoporphyrin O-methyltransferase